MKRLMAIGFVLLTGCYGRLPDGESLRIDPKAYGLDGKRPALLVFSAVWCKPCVSEIPELNEAQREFAGRLQVAGFVVEGPQKGVSAAPKDTDDFVSPSGVKPEYSIQLDPSWKLFDALQPASGRALPTMVFVSAEQTVVRIIQRSMNYQAELLPALKALAEGATPPADPPPPKPDPTPEDPGKTVNQNFSTWSQSPGNEPGSVMYQNVHAAWERGLSDFAFLEEDMPFNSAKLTVLVYTDGHSRPLSAIWLARETGCRLTVFFKRDGSYDRSEGICR